MFGQVMLSTVLGGALLSAPVSAQNARPAGAALDSGTRIRATVVSSLYPVTGTVVGIRTDTLLVKADGNGSAVAIPLAQLIRLDVSHGARTTTRRGAIVGLGLGALAGMVVGAVTYRKADCTGSFICIDVGPGPDMTVGAGVGALAGLFVGAAVGSRSIEIWEPMMGPSGGPLRFGAAAVTDLERVEESTQSRPDGTGRVWAEVGLGGALQAQGCGACARQGPIAGLSISGAAGASFAHGLGAAVLVRAFREVDFEYTQGSRYVVGLAQYTPPRTPFVTLSAGAGWGAHNGDPAAYTNDGRGAVLAAGLALRVPASGRVALSVSGDVLQSVSGTRASAAGPGASSHHPRLVTLGVGLSVASARSR